MAHNLVVSVLTWVDQLDLVFAESSSYDCCWRIVVGKEQVLSQ